MKIYLAHNYIAREILPATIKILEQRGHHVTSRWITQDSHSDPEQKKQSALADIHDVERADALILFADQYGPRPGRGKWVELGYALGQGKLVVVVGGDGGCIFTHLSEVYLKTVSSLEEAIEYLEANFDEEEEDDLCDIPF